jgi:hypothetical protein
LEKARHGGAPPGNDDCEIRLVLNRLDDKIHDAMEEFDKMPDRDQKWHEINCNAQKLLDDISTKGAESVLAVFVFLSALDQDRTVRSTSSSHAGLRPASLEIPDS